MKAQKRKVKLHHYFIQKKTRLMHTHYSHVAAAQHNTRCSINWILRLVNMWRTISVNWCFLFTGCPGGNVPEFGRMFLTLKYTHLTQNTYIRGWTVTEILVRKKVWSSCGSTYCTRSADALPIHCACPPLTVECSQRSRLIPKCAVSNVKSVLQYCWICMCYVKFLEP